MPGVVDAGSDFEPFGRDGRTLSLVWRRVLGSSMVPSIHLDSEVLLDPSKRTPRVGAVIAFRSLEDEHCLHRVIRQWHVARRCFFLERGDGDELYSILPQERILGTAIAQRVDGRIVPILSPPTVGVGLVRLALFRLMSAAYVLFPNRLTSFICCAVIPTLLMSLRCGGRRRSIMSTYVAMVFRARLMFASDPSRRKGGQGKHRVH